jgi:hypothetical protein
MVQKDEMRCYCQPRFCCLRNLQSISVYFWTLANLFLICCGSFYIFQDVLRERWQIMELLND